MEGVLIFGALFALSVGISASLRSLGTSRAGAVTVGTLPAIVFLFRTMIRGEYRGAAEAGIDWGVILFCVAFIVFAVLGGFIGVMMAHSRKS